tara:strand:- start:488 stop:688 length:201 start_codon:yes stop_codon:yes gene_type:complete
MKIPDLKDRQIYLLQSQIQQLEEDIANQYSTIDDLRIYSLSLEDKIKNIEEENKKLKNRIQNIFES